MLNGQRVYLEPLRVEHADELMPVLNDSMLHTYAGGEPADLAQLRARYRRQLVGRSPDGSQRWLNWLVRGEDGQALGTVQATVSEKEDELAAEVAWVIGTAHQGQGYAREATGVPVTWLRHPGVQTLIAHVHPNTKRRRQWLAPWGCHQRRLFLTEEVRWEA